MKHSSIASLGAAIIVLIGRTDHVAAATLQVTITNTAPAGSVSIRPQFSTDGMPSISNVQLTSVSGEPGEILPDLEFLVGLNAAGTQFPDSPGAEILPPLRPGESVSFSLIGVDLMSHDSLGYGIALFGERALGDGLGNAVPFDVSLPANSLADFVDEGGALRLVIPGSPSVGPSSITPNTHLLRLTVVPEPSTVGLATLALGVLTKRRRRDADGL